MKKRVKCGLNLAVGLAFRYFEVQRNVSRKYDGSLPADERIVLALGTRLGQVEWHGKREVKESRDSPRQRVPRTQSVTNGIALGRINRIVHDACDG